MKYPVSIKGVLFIGDRVVLLRNDRNEWELPGGRIEQGESPRQCLAREMLEELGVRVAVADIIDSYLFEAVPNQYVFIVTYGCITEASVPRVSDEHLEVGLFQVGELGTMPLPDGYAQSIVAWAHVSKEGRS